MQSAVVRRRIVERTRVLNICRRRAD